MAASVLLGDMLRSCRDCGWWVKGIGPLKTLKTLKFLYCLNLKSRSYITPFQSVGADENQDTSASSASSAENFLSPLWLDLTFN
jgi:hypothetical protein